MIYSAGNSLSFPFCVLLLRSGVLFGGGSILTMTENGIGAGMGARSKVFLLSSVQLDVHGHELLSRRLWITFPCIDLGALAI